MVPRDVAPQACLGQVPTRTKGTVVHREVLGPAVDRRGPPPVRKAISPVWGRQQPVPAVPGHRRVVPPEPVGEISGLEPPRQRASPVVDPHGHHLADAIWKLRGLADFAEQYTDEFRRIESVAETAGTMRVLDLTKTEVRQAIRDADSARGLYESDLATDY